MIKTYPFLNSLPISQLCEEIKNSKNYFGYCLDISYGSVFINKIRSEISSDKKLIIILNVDYPELYIKQLKLNKDDIIFIYQETLSNLNIEHLAEEIKKSGNQTGICLTQNTPLESLVGVAFNIKNVLLLGPTDSNGSEKLIALNNMKEANNFNFDIYTLTKSIYNNQSKLSEQGSKNIILIK